MLIVTRLDRLVRSTRDLLNVIAALADRVCHARGRSPEGQEAEGRPCRMIFRSRMQRLPLRYAVKTWPGSPAIFFTRLYLNHDVSSDWIKIEAFNLNCGGPFWSDHSDIAAAAPVARNSAATPAMKRPEASFRTSPLWFWTSCISTVRGLCAGADQ